MAPAWDSWCPRLPTHHLCQRGPSREAPLSTNSPVLCAPQIPAPKALPCLAIVSQGTRAGQKLRGENPQSVSQGLPFALSSTLLAWHTQGTGREGLPRCAVAMHSPLLTLRTWLSPGPSRAV